MQADVRKKVLWGQWAECAMLGRMTGTDGRRCGRTMATTRGQLPLLPTASSDLDTQPTQQGCGFQWVSPHLVPESHGARWPVNSRLESRRIAFRANPVRISAGPGWVDMDPGG